MPPNPDETGRPWPARRVRWVDVELTGGQRAFLQQHHTAAMATLRPDGSVHVVRMASGLVDGRIWSSATQDRVRTRHVRRDPRATLYVYDQAYAFLTVESRVSILEDAGVPEKSLRFFQTLQAGMQGLTPGMVLWHGQERTPEEFLRLMVEERRIIFEFEPIRAYGLG